MTDPYLSPDALLAQQVGTDLARHYGLPSFSYAGMADSKVLDEQWSAEAALSMAYGSLSRATLLHDVGYLESGLQSSYEAIVLGDELVGYARQFMRQVPVDDYSLALDEIKAAGPGGNHLATKYTRRHHREFWTPSLLDHNVHDRWAAEGATTLGARVREKLAGLLAAGRPFALTAEQDARLNALLDEALADQGARV
jgi:trimethylamine--corrinoid protein Co-methyltransferase